MSTGPVVGMVVWNDFRNDARVLKEARTLARSGYRVTVHALMTSGTPPRETLEPGLEVRRAGRLGRPHWLPRARPRASPAAAEAAAPASTLKLLARSLTHAILAFRLAAMRADLVHAHDVNVLPTAWLAARLSGARLIYDAHEISTAREGYAPYRRLVGWVEKHLTPRVDAMITTTEMRARYFARAYGVQRPLVLQNRPARLPAGRTDRIRRELGLAESWPIVLYQGGIQRGRGLEQLVDAVAAIPECYLVLIGGGRLSPFIARRLSERGLAGRAHIIPTVPVDELADYTASADIGVQPLLNTCLNHFTTDSNKLFEYAMAGLPVVASNFPEIRRIVRAHDIGILFDPSRDGALLAALSALLGDPAARERYGANARLGAGSLCWEEQEDRLLALYASLLRRPVAAHRLAGGSVGPMRS